MINVKTDHDKNIKLHWWHMCFMEPIATGTRTCDGYRYQSHQPLTAAGIRSMQHTLGLADSKAVVTSCAYLGEMTINEFNDGIGSERK